VQSGASCWRRNSADAADMAASACVERADLEAGTYDQGFTESEIVFRELQARDVIELKELQLALFPARQQAQSILACSPRDQPLLERPYRHCLARSSGHWRSALAARVPERGYSAPRYSACPKSFCA